MSKCILPILISDTTVLHYWWKTYRKDLKIFGSLGHDVRAISNYIIEGLEPLIGKNLNKLVAQSYDDAYVNGVQKFMCV